MATKAVDIYSGRAWRFIIFNEWGGANWWECQLDNPGFTEEMIDGIEQRFATVSVIEEGSRRILRLWVSTSSAPNRRTRFALFALWLKVNMDRDNVVLGLPSTISSDGVVRRAIEREKESLDKSLVLRNDFS